MKKIISTLTLLSFVCSNFVFAAGKLQNEDFKTLSQITGAGGTAANLLNDTKVYVTANGINQQLSSAISSGLIGGNSSGGVQLLSNASFEIGTSASSWTLGGTGTYSTVTSQAYAGSQSESIVLSSQTPVLSQDVTPATSYSGVNMEASCKVLAPSAISTVQVCARNAGASLGSSFCQLVPNTGAWTYVPVNFVGPASGSMGVQVTTSAAATGTIYVDDCYVGPARNIGATQQAQLYGSLTYAATSGCTWTTTSTTMANFSAQASCPTPTVGQNASAPATKIPGITFASMPPGDYLFIANTTFGSPSSQNMGLRFSDGTNVSSAAEFSANNATAITTTTFSSHLNYTAPQSNVTIQLQAAVSSGTGSIFANSTAPAYGFELLVYYHPTQSQVISAQNMGRQPTVQIFTSGSGTYTTPAGVSRIEVEVQGGGGGGGGSAAAGNNNGGAGTAGNNSTFGSSLITANGGNAGTGSNTGFAGSGGSFTVNSPAIDIGSTNGGSGSQGSITAVANVSVAGGWGGASVYGGAGAGGQGNTVNGGAAQANSGGGGGGASSAQSSSSVAQAGGGGGAGGYAHALIVNPASSYSYSVGGTAGGGLAGTGGGATGGVGAAGKIIVHEYYGLANAPIVVNSITTNSNAAWHHEAAGVSCSSSSTINSQTGSWISSISNVSSGCCTLTVAAGEFSSAPFCTVNVAASAAASLAAVISNTNTNTAVTFCGSSAGSALASGNYQISCDGPR